MLEKQMFILDCDEFCREWSVSVCARKTHGLQQKSSYLTVDLFWNVNGEYVSWNYIRSSKLMSKQIPATNNLNNIIAFRRSISCILMC